MTTQTLHPRAEDYLRRLRSAARGLPRSRRRELVTEVEAHLLEAIDPDASDAEVLTILDRLGDPEEIVADEQPRHTVAADPRGIHEWGAIILVLLGGFVAGVGWVVGVVLLWASRTWTTRDKWIGTLIVPGGLAGSFLFFAVTVPLESCVIDETGRETCTGGTSSAGAVLLTVGAVLAVLAPIATAIYLARRARVGSVTVSEVERA